MALPSYTQLAPPESPVARDKREARALRQLFIHLTLVVGLFFVWLGYRLFEPPITPPDLSNYVDLWTLDEAFLDLENPHRRIIMVGDLHGMLHSLNNLTNKLQYNPTNDILIHLGDITAKGPHSNELVRKFAAANTTGVRGNNDQKVIEWYGWFEWVKSHEDGDQWLKNIEALDIPTRTAKKQGLYRTIKYRFPKDWEWNGDHYHVARNLSVADYTYLSSLPIVIHLPSIHTFMVHAGIVPTDPSHHLRSHNQPLAIAPKLPPNATHADIEAARFHQERALLTKIKPNRDPYIKLNLRDVHDLKPTRRGPKGHDDNIPWSDLWNDVIKKCKGFDGEGVGDEPGEDPLEDLDQAAFSLKGKTLPCWPITVVYSHASGRGLDLKKWSKGLDTGCVNGDGLTAMILGKGRHAPIIGTPTDDDDERDIEVRFGENHKARLVSVACPTPPPIDDE